MLTPAAPYSCHNLVDPSESRLLFAVLAALPYLMVYKNETDLNHLSFHLSANLAKLAELNHQPKMAKWLTGTVLALRLARLTNARARE